jgi:hypothetical protein
LNHLALPNIAIERFHGRRHLIIDLNIALGDLQRRMSAQLLDDFR